MTPGAPAGRIEAPARVAVVGAAGRMGRLLVALLEEAPDFEVTLRVERRLAPVTADGTIEGAVEEQISPLLAGTPIGSLDALLEFSVARALPALAREVRRLGCAWVSGTTGLAGEARAALESAAEVAPVLWAPNFSLGVALLRRFVREAAELLPDSWEMEVVEVHHGAKVDAPSGTALALASAWASVRGGELTTGRSGSSGPRPTSEIGLHAVRLPEGIGEHRVFLGGYGEVLELSHRATDRAAFARGAIEATRWLLGRPPGLYTLDDWLRDRLPSANIPPERRG